MNLHDDFVWCQGCGVEITWAPILVDQRTYCCEECSHGIQCRCAERIELDDDYRSGSSSTLPPYT